MNGYIIITTINDRTPAIEKFEAVADWKTILVGDRKTPDIASSESLHFYSISEQLDSGLEVTRVLPVNHYCRKNAGYLFALSKGASVIYDTDDDNLPYAEWNVPAFASGTVLRSRNRYVNVYRHFTQEEIWPRGFPLDALRDPAGEAKTLPMDVPVGVWQAMADGDPDVDAIHRLVHGRMVRFEQQTPVHLERGVYCPFNSQATAWTEAALPFLYLPSTVSFRFTDILRGYVAQRLMWEQGLHLGFMSATVYQERNEHDLMRDFADEIEMYLGVRKVVEVLDGLSLHGDPLQDQYDAYAALHKAGVVEERELEILSAWNHDFEHVIGGRN